MAIVAEFSLEERRGAVDRKIPFLRTRKDLDLVHALRSGNIDLQKDLALRRFLLGIPKLLPAEIPVGVEPAGIPGRQKEATGSVTFGQVSQVFVGRQFRFRRRGRKGLKDEFVGGLIDWKRALAKPGSRGGSCGRRFFRPALFWPSDHAKTPPCAHRRAAPPGHHRLPFPLAPMTVGPSNLADFPPLMSAQGKPHGIDCL